MKMKGLNVVELIKTDVGNYLVTIREVTERGITFYEGSVIDDNIKLSVRARTKEDYFLTMKYNIEKEIHDWVNSQISEYNIVMSEN